MSGDSAKRIAVALEVRRVVAEWRRGKPLAFPDRRRL